MPRLLTIPNNHQNSFTLSKRARASTALGTQREIMTGSINQLNGILTVARSFIPFISSVIKCICSKRLLLPAGQSARETLSPLCSESSPAITDPFEGLRAGFEKEITYASKMFPSRFSQFRKKLSDNDPRCCCCCCCCCSCNFCCGCRCCSSQTS